MNTDNMQIHRDFLKSILSNTVVNKEEMIKILNSSDLPKYEPRHLGHESPVSNAGKVLYALGRSACIKTALVCFAGPPGPNGLFCLSKGFDNKNGTVWAIEGRRRYAVLNWLFLFVHGLTKNVIVKFKRIDVQKDHAWFDHNINIPTIDLFAVDIDDMGSESLYSFIIEKYKPKLIFVENSGYKSNIRASDSLDYMYEDKVLHASSNSGTGPYRLLIDRYDSNLKVHGRKFSLYIREEFLK